MTFFSQILSLHRKKPTEMRQKFRHAFAILMSLILVSCDSSQEWVNLAREKHSQGNIAEALYYYDLALRKNPDNVVANRNLGILLAESNEAPGSAAFYLEKAHIKDPKNPDILLYLLEIYLKAGSKTESDRVLKSFADGWDKDRESLAKFLKECLLDEKKNPSERKRFQENRIPDANPASKRMFRECEEKLYPEISGKS
ncbi:tetratricopeptide repeat protein [Leptospira broomii serovar Hurstbridge str. 5399]|uniref:Tetratricopeptide repeat protein n=1 Tax=Leptospira broomii serovar Hurstbridge str. 5399 TaxID=1049789 RepID=T0FI66_9LEPT|nr:tetratricopeptide repeat protein [Leptospira broomii serovar Hurstbridge str. 5399]